MADKTVSVTLQGKDNLSPVFQKVGTAATAAGKSIDTAGKTASASLDAIERNTAETVVALNRLAEASTKAEQSTSRLSSTASKIGAAIGTGLVGGLLLSVRAAAEAEVSQQRLQATIESTGAIFEQYASQIDAVNSKGLSLSFDDEDVQDALSGLIQGTGDVQQALDQMGLAEDIARGRGIDLAAATKIVMAADQERFAALKRLGIQIDENSTKESVLADLQTRYAGQAEAYANTNAGAFDRWQNSVENAAESVGAFLGPAQQLLMVFPGLAAGLVGMSSGLAKLGGTSGAISAFAGLLSGPAGIVGAAALAAVGIGALANYLSSDYVDATDAADKATGDFTQSLIQMGQQGTLSMLNQQIAQHGLIIGQYAEDQAKAADGTHDFIEEMKGLQTFVGGPGGVINARTEEVTKNFTDAQVALIDGIQEVNGQIVQGAEDGVLSYEELQLAIDNTNVALTNTGETAQQYAQNWGAAQEDVIAIMQGTGDAGVEAQKQLVNVMDNVQHGLQTMGGARKTIAEIRETMDANTASTIANGDAIDGNTASYEKNSASVVKWLDAGGRIHTLNDDIATSMVDLGAASVELGPALEHVNSVMLDVVSTLGQMATADIASLGGDLADFLINGGKAAEQFASAWLDVGRAMAGDVAGDVDALGGSLYDFIRNGSQAADVAKEMARSFQLVQALGGEAISPFAGMDLDFNQIGIDKLAAQFDAVTTAVTGTTKALDSGFQVVVGNTNAIAQSAQGVQDWADQLIGAAGVYGTMDDLLARGVITQQNYNDAAAAYTPIAEANARIQDDVLAIQTAQAPVQAELMQQQADYLDSVKAMSPELQTYTLAMMDSATSTEALNLATSLLGENGDTFAPMVESAANLNPYLASILEQMGLIEQQPDGTYKVTADTSDAQSQIDQLIASNNRLIQSQWLIKYDGDASDAEAAYERAVGDATAWDNLTSTSTVDADTSPADAAFDSAQNRASEWDRTTATATANVNDNASGAIAVALGLLNQFDGRSATAYLTTVVSTVGGAVDHALQAYGGTTAYANGGTSPYGFSRAAANGMTATLVGERGPEVLMLPGGAQVMNTEGSRSRMRGSGSSGVTVNLTINGSVGVDDLTDHIVSEISKGLVRANQMHERSMGL